MQVGGEGRLENRDFKDYTLLKAFHALYIIVSYSTLDIHAIVQGGTAETLAESRWLSMSTEPSNEQPSKSRPPTYKTMKKMAIM